MKKLVLILIILLLFLAACGYSGSVTVTTLPTTTASPPPTATAEVSVIASPSAAQSVTPAPTASPSPAPSVTHAPTTSHSPAKNITVITATSYGEIFGGYSKGKWLSAGEAAALCKGNMTFSLYSLVESKGKVKSSGVTYDDEYTDVGCYFLNFGDGYVPDDYSEDHLYYGGKLPDIETVSDTSKISSAVQTLLDKKIGKGKAEANIIVAVIADIDGDGKKETAVNARGLVDDADDSEYRLNCIIESDGTVKIIDEYHFFPTEEVPYDIVPGTFYLQNIIDLDGDGRNELVFDETSGEEYGYSVYKYDGKKFSKVIDYWVVDYCP